MHDSYSVKGPKAYMCCKINVYSCAQIKPSRLPQRPGFIKCCTHHIIMKALLARYSFPLSTPKPFFYVSVKADKDALMKNHQKEKKQQQHNSTLNCRAEIKLSNQLEWKENDSQLFKAPNPCRRMSVFPQRLNSQDSDGRNVLMTSILEKTVDFLPERDVKSAI